MSHGRDARRKVRRQEARAAQSEPRRRPARTRRLVAAVPALAIAAILAVVGVAGFGSSTGVSKEQSRREVAALLSGIPQNGATLGSPRAPITLQIFSDLECPTVSRFVVSYLPSIVDTWVRTGAMKLEYRSLQTDTQNERTFLRQEVAALAAGRQDKMWNFLLTFAREQRSAFTDYATIDYLTSIAEQVPSLNRPRWYRERRDPLLLRQVVLGVHSAHLKGLHYTPSFLIGFSSTKPNQNVGLGDPVRLRHKIESSLRRDVKSLRAEDLGDVSTLGTIQLEQAG